MPPSPFRVELIDAPSAIRREEQLGTKAKFWFDREGHSALFKRGRLNEDWSEKAAAECADLIGLPHAVVELAEHEHHPGVVSLSFLADGDALIHGNEVLLALDPTYPLQRRYHVAEHALDSIFEAFERDAVEAPPSEAFDWPAGFDARDVFTGYLMLDAWIGNSDRHHENWAVLRRGSRKLLAPTYDHASSMGRNETPDRVARRLAADDPRVTVQAYAERCRSAIYRASSDAHPMSAHEAFLEGARRRPEAAMFWRQQLTRVDDERIEGLFGRFPTDRPTAEYKRFAVEILRFNRTRILSSNR